MNFALRKHEKSLLKYLEKETSFKENIPRCYQLQESIKSQIFKEKLKPENKIHPAYLLAELFDITKVTVDKDITTTPLSPAHSLLFGGIYTNVQILFGTSAQQKNKRGSSL